MIAAWTRWPLPPAGTDMWEWQDGRCAWCGHEDPVRRLDADHCHMTGLVRGYLCRACNINESVSFDPAWDEWREGDNPAFALKHFEVYRNNFGATPISSQGALHWYSHSERMAWFELIVPHMEAGAPWPTDAPWLDTAIARRDAAYAQVNEAFTQMLSDAFNKGAAS